MGISVSLSRILLTATLLFTTGCTTINKQVDGWPSDMKVTKHEVGFWEVQERCWKDLPWYWKLTLPIAGACTNLNLDTNTCDIYYPKGVSNEVMAHELAHCTGGDHDGMLQEYFDKWKASKN